MTDTMAEWQLIEQIRTKHNHVLILHKHSCCAKQKKSGLHRLSIK